MGLPTKPPTQMLPESASVLLDIARFTAAIMVVVTHMTQPEFHLGYSNQAILGDIAVPLFFVLSGFVIRYVTNTREATPRDYFIDRASRIYSVVIPAMAFTLAVVGVCYLLDREQFQNDWSSRCSHPIQRLLLNLVYFSQAWGHNTIAFVNLPFWSMGYECIYYVFYGFLFYFRGWKRAVPCIALAAAIGPQVLFLFPIWWLGCWIYDLYVWCRGGWAAKIVLLVGVGWLAAGAGLAVAGYGEALKAPLALFWMVARLPNPIGFFGMPPMRATMFAMATGVLSGVVLLMLLLLMDQVHISRSNRWAVGFRQIANGTFTIYLAHYPFLVLLLFAGALRPGHRVENILTGVVLCSALIGLAVPVDKLKLNLRMRLRHLFPAGLEHYEVSGIGVRFVGLFSR